MAFSFPPGLLFLTFTLFPPFRFSSFVALPFAFYFDFSFFYWYAGNSVERNLLNAAFKGNLPRFKSNSHIFFTFLYLIDRFSCVGFDFCVLNCWTRAFEAAWRERWFSGNSCKYKGRTWSQLLPCRCSRRWNWCLQVSFGGSKTWHRVPEWELRYMWRKLFHVEWLNDFVVLFLYFDHLSINK